MNRFPDKTALRRRPWLIIALLWLLAGPGGQSLAADTAGPGEIEKADQKIRITADRLVANAKTGSAEFSGHVRATQGATVITSDRLEVHYDQAAGPDTDGQSAAAIKSITASGHVVIEFDDKIATTDKAVYNSRTGIFTLTGKGTRVTSGDNAITGEAITVDRKNDRMTVESGEASRVNAVIFTDQGGLALPTGKSPPAEQGGKP